MQKRKKKLDVPVCVCCQAKQTIEWFFFFCIKRVKLCNAGWDNPLLINRMVDWKNIATFMCKSSIEDYGWNLWNWIQFTDDYLQASQTSKAQSSMPVYCSSKTYLLWNAWWHFICCVASFGLCTRIFYIAKCGVFVRVSVRPCVHACMYVCVLTISIGSFTRWNVY